MITRLFIGTILLLAGCYYIYEGTRDYELVSPLPPPVPIWQVRSIDTMKYSRDLSKEKLKDQSFDEVIDRQISSIADTGASHVAIATPYDPEFIPILSRWVSSARAHNLHVWFRGNLSGWEKWFGYSRISMETHEAGIGSFILSNPHLFESGDLFTPCPECENGGEGDPRMTGKVQEYREFLIREYNLSSDAFRTIGKDVSVGYFSMNYDVAKLVMDKPTTKALGGIVAIDHYVKSPEKMIDDIEKIKVSSGGQVYLGEFGAPIPDIHGSMTQSDQSAWVKQVLESLRQNRSVIGINYWVGTGGSTKLWDEDGTPREAVVVLTDYYQRLETHTK